MIFKKDNLRLGLVLGLVAPIISLVIYYFIQFRMYSVQEFFFFLRTNKQQVTGISVICLVANIALFTFYTNSHRDFTARGIFVSTILYAIAALLFKYI